MKNNEAHIRLREKVCSLLETGVSIEQIANNLNISLGSRYLRGSAKWHKYCVAAKKNQQKAIEKHPNLYSKAGITAQQKHPWIGHQLGKKYGPSQGKKNVERLKGKTQYFSMMANKLQEKDPNHSVINMRKAHETMKRNGTFNEHQKNAALKCIEKNPLQLKEMSRKAHVIYPLALLALESRRRNYPFEFMGCFFDSNSERELCKLFVNHGLMIKPEERKNVHFRIAKYHIDFFINHYIFVEFHPLLNYGRAKNETIYTYYAARRKILDEHGYKDHILMVITSLKQVESKINEIKRLVSLKFDQ